MDLGFLQILLSLGCLPHSDPPLPTKRKKKIFSKRMSGPAVRAAVEPVNRAWAVPSVGGAGRSGILACHPSGCAEKLVFSGLAEIPGNWSNFFTQCIEMAAPHLYSTFCDLD